MDGDAVREMREGFAQPQVLTVRGREVGAVPAGFAVHDPGPVEPKPLAIGTLQGVVDYVTINRDGLDLERVTLHVEGPDRVAVIDSLDLKAPDERWQVRRWTLARATAPDAPFPLGRFVDAEEFTIALQSRFTSAGDQKAVLELVASLRDSEVRDVVDNGVSQEVSVKVGVTLADRARVPNPVSLAPFRTFREVDQPASLFVLRFQKCPDGGKPKGALFEADGGAWRVTAVRSVTQWLADKLAAGPASAVKVLS